MIRRHIIFISVVLALLIAFAGVCPAVAAVRKPLRGELEWRYADYQADHSDGRSLEASHFTQKYTLMYNVAGNLYNSRGGIYNGGIGLEWWNLDAEFGDEDISLSDMKPLYNGEVLLAPTGLPFRMHLFAYDRATVNFIAEDYNVGVVGADIFTDVTNGSSRVMGGTLVAGIRNGSYQGEFRDILSRFPKLYVDFRQTDSKDTESTSPTHTRDRRLAFVSLNKKDNWFHYRFNQHEDFVDEANNYDERIVMLGTVDHLLYRQWIWLTNWLELSTDGSFTTLDYFVNDGEPSHEYAYNLFLVGSKGALSFSNMNQFERRTVGNEVYKYLEIPLYLSYDISPDRQLRGSLTLEREDNTFGLHPPPDNSYDDIYVEGKLATGMISPVRTDYGLEVEYYAGQGSLGQGLSERGSIEAYSNARYRNRQEWLASYALANFAGNNSDDQSVDFVEQVAELTISRQLTPTWTFSGDQRLVYGSGTIDTSIARHISPESEQGAFGSLNDIELTDGTVLHSTTVLAFDHRRGRLSNRLAAMLDYIKVSDQDATEVYEFRHRLDYQGRELRVKVKSLLRFDENAGQFGGGFASASLPVGALDGAGDTSFENHSEIDYAPGRNWRLSAESHYQWQGGGDADSSLLNVRQEGEYTFFHSNGVLRRWLALNQEMTYEKSWDDYGGNREYMSFTLGTEFLPTYSTYVRTNVGYEIYDPGFNSFTYGLVLGVVYPLFKVEATYDYGLTEDDDGNELKEHRWELIVKKMI